MAAPSDALPQLQEFITQARVVDSALQAMSVRVNAGVGAEAMRIRSADVTALRAIEPHRLVSRLPGGLPAELLGPALLVYADLVSRRDAFNRWDEFASESPLARDSAHGKELLACLGNGSQAAAHFATDLAALQSAVASAGAAGSSAADSRAAAEVAVRAALVETANGGCASCGGAVPRPFVLWPITWQRIVLAPGSVWDGRIGSTPFAVRYSKAGGWTANIDAC